jgi:hypothetical protein
MRVLILAHPRSGTAYAAHCFQRCGWDVGHERIGADGISSWMWAVESSDVPWGAARVGEFENVLHILRNPAACVSSVAYVERASEDWRRRYIPIPEDCEAIERAVWSIAGWSRLIRDKTPPNITAQLEHVERAVAKITGAEELGAGAPKINGRMHATLTADQIKATHWVYPETAVLWDKITADYEGAGL